MRDVNDNELTVEQLKNCVVVYKGGGYDGCFWEYNYSYFDVHGVRYDIYSSGWMGRDITNSEQSFIDMMNNEEWDCTVYMLSDKEQYDAMIEFEPLNVLIGLGRWFTNEAPNDTNVTIRYKCEECEELHNIYYMDICSYHGNGGVGIEVDGLTCGCGLVYEEC